MPTKHLTFSPAFLALCKAIDDAKAAQETYRAALDAASTARVAAQDAQDALHEARLASAYEGIDLTPRNIGVIIDVAVSE